MASRNCVAGLRGSSLQSCRPFYKAGATVPPGRMAAGVQPEEEEAFFGFTPAAQPLYSLASEA